MENDLLRKLRENMKRLQKEEETSRLPLLSSTTEERSRAEVSRRPEMRMGQDLSLKMRSHQIVQTKTERLEVDLKRARDQSYIKTMEMSKLLAEKEELELKIQQLINKTLQLAKEKGELCEEYEEKLNRKNSSDESGQLDKLRRENECLSCKVQKYAGEKAELLRENNDLKEEFYRETQLRKGCCTLLIGREQMDQRHGSSECKRSSVSVCQTSADIAENKTEAQDKMEPQMVGYQLNKKWLKASVDSLKIKTSKESGPNILRWLQQLLKILKEDSSELYTLPEWLKASTTNLPKECAEASRGDVKGWLEASINHLQEEGPETCDLDVQGWLEASIIGIQHLQKSKSGSPGSLKKGWLEKSIENLKKQCPEGSLVNILEWLQGSLESLSLSGEPRPVLEKWLRQSLKNLQEESPDVSKQDAIKWLKISIKNLEEERPKTPHLDTQEWLKASIKGIRDLQKSTVEITRTLRKRWFENSIKNLKKQCSEGPMENILQ